MNLKVVKITDWTTSKGETGQTITCAYRGRVFNCNPEDFEVAPKIENNVLKFTEKPVVIKEPWIDVDGNKRTGLKLKPALGLDFEDA